MLQILILSLERTHGFRQYISHILMSGDRQLSVLTERGGGGQAGSFIGRLSFSSNKKFQQLLHPAHLTSCNIWQIPKHMASLSASSIELMVARSTILANLRETTPSKSQPARGETVLFLSLPEFMACLITIKLPVAGWANTRSSGGTRSMHGRCRGRLGLRFGAKIRETSK